MQDFLTNLWVAPAMHDYTKSNIITVCLFPSRFGFCDIRNNLGTCKRYQPRPWARLIYNIFLDLEYSGYHHVQKLFIINFTNNIGEIR